MKTFLDWSAYREAGMGDAYADIPKRGGDFARAVAVCINSRQCETHKKGVMCPSFRATGDPNLSTGGRVRLLKAMLNGEQEALVDDAGLDASIDLCVACKGCKRECESEVDLAMIKVEYLAQRNARYGVSLRTLLLAGLPHWLHRHPRLAWLLDRRNRSPLLRRLSQRLLGISAKRTLPIPSPQPFRADTSALLDPGVDRTEVVLFIDTFTRDFAPENAEAAIEVLQAGGYRVLLAASGPESKRPLCCGRTHIAHGLVDKAKAEAERTLAVLQPHAQAGRPIIGLEPACLLAIRDDYRFLGLGEIAEQVADKAILFEEFIAKELAAKRFKASFKPVDCGGSPLLVHGHCHQKAVGAMKAMRKVLKAIPELDFKLIDSTCCGMAGSFGIEKEHADIAMDMAEQNLLPELRIRPKARILANGFSCRHQIREGVDRPSFHLARLLREALA